MSENKEENEINLKKLNEYLDNEKYKEALDLVRNSRSQTWFCNASWDTIPLVTKYINPENEGKNPEKVKCCQDILEEIAKVCSPEESLFELLDKLECKDNDILLLSLLGPVDIILSRLPSRRVQSLEWCLTALKESLSVIELDDEKRLKNVFGKIEEFYKKYCSKVARNNVSEEFLNDPKSEYI